jgi:hypothetical protein
LASVTVCEADDASAPLSDQTLQRSAARPRPPAKGILAISIVFAGLAITVAWIVLLGFGVIRLVMLLME